MLPTVTRIKANLRSPVGKRVAAYAHVSGAKDAQLNSLAAQTEYYTTLIKSNPCWIFQCIYVDEAVSGTLDKRPEFQRLLTDCRARRIDIVLTKSISRFARNTVTLLETVRELKGLGIDVFFERENIHSLSGDGEFMLTLLASYAQEESRSVSENCKWRIRNDFKKGRLCSMRIFGYKLIDGALQIVPEEAEIVRAIYQDFLSGMGASILAKKYRALGMKTSYSGICALLRNEKYTGNLLLQKRFKKDHIQKKEIRNRGELPQYFVTGSHEPIIDNETYKNVQAELERRARRYDTTAQTISQFTGLIRCGHCGKLHKRKHNSAGTKYEKIVWICPTYDIYGKDACSSQQIPGDILGRKTQEVLNDRSITSIKKIQVPARNRLVFFFHDGNSTEISWQNASRRDSWTPEMREAARKKTQERMDKKWPKSV